VLRRAKTIAILSLHTADIGEFEQLCQKLRPTFGYPAMTFATILPTEADLPGGAKFAKTSNDKREVLDCLAVEELRLSEIAAAFHATLDDGGSVWLIELKEENKAWGLQSEIQKRYRETKRGAAMYKDAWLCVVEAEDEDSAFMLENRMREKFGWDPRTR
jgi:hypothetical protein